MNLQSLAPGQQPGREPQTGMDMLALSSVGVFVPVHLREGRVGRVGAWTLTGYVLPAGTLLRPLRYATMGAGTLRGKGAWTGLRGLDTDTDPLGTCLPAWESRWESRWP